MNTPNEFTSIHQLLRTIRGKPLVSKEEQPALKEVVKADSQPPLCEPTLWEPTEWEPAKQQQPPRISQLKALKRELEKADALLYQLEQDEVVPTSPVAPPMVTEFHQPRSLIRQTTQIRPLFTKTSLGLDIGSSAIKAVELGQTPAGYTLLYYALVEITPVGGDSADYPKGLREGIKQAIAGVNLRQTEVVTSIGSPSTFVHQLSLPRMSESELSACLGWEAKRLIPDNRQEIELNFQVLKGRDKASLMEVLLVAVPRSLIANHWELMAQSQVKPAVTDIAPLALINAYLAAGKDAADEALVVLDLGAETSTLTIYRDNGGYFVRHISVSGNSLTRQIQKLLRMEFLQAEQWKRHPHQEIIELLEPILQQMTLEIRQTLTHYKNKTLVRGFKRLILGGGSALLPQLDSYLSRELGLEVELFNPLVGLNIDGSYFPKIDLNGVSSQLATAVGLAIRGFNQDSKAINLSESRVLGTAEANVTQAHLGVFAPAGSSP